MVIGVVVVGAGVVVFADGVVVVGDGVVVVGARVVVVGDEVVAVVVGVGDGQWVGEVAIVGNVVFLVSSFLPASAGNGVGSLVVVGGAELVVCLVDVVKDCSGSW